MSEFKRRRFARIIFHRHGELEFPDSKYTDCQIKDLSLTGMYVFGSFQQQVGEHCLVKLYQKGQASELALLADAKVVRTGDKGLAIDFTSMSFDSYMFLQVTLLYEADEPLYIGLELPDDCPFQITDQESTSSSV